MKREQRREIEAYLEREYPELFETPPTESVIGGICSVLWVIFVGLLAIATGIPWLVLLLAFTVAPMWIADNAITKKKAQAETATPVTQ